MRMFPRRKRQRCRTKNDVVIDIPEHVVQIKHNDLINEWFDGYDYNRNAGDNKNTIEEKKTSGSVSFKLSENEAKRIAEANKEAQARRQAVAKKIEEAKMAAEAKEAAEAKQAAEARIEAVAKIEAERLHIARSLTEYADMEKDIYQLVIDGNKAGTVNYLARNPNEINVPNQEGFYPIHLAIINNHPSIMQELMKMNVDLNVVDHEGKTALHHAILVESAEMVATLVSKEVSLTMADNTGMMPLHTASEIGSLRIMAIILPSYQNLSLKGEGGLTPLHVAATNNKGNIITLLLHHGAYPLNKDDHGNYPIHCAAKSAANNAIEALVASASLFNLRKSDIMSLRDRDKNMPIHCAVISGNIQTVKICLKEGASLMSQQADGSTPLHLVAAQGLMEMAKVMSDTQLESFLKSVNSYDLLKRTPLHWATVFNHLTMVSYLLEQGARINSMDVDGNAPILIAASKGYVKTVKVLLASGAEPFMKDRKRRNFLHLLVLSMEIVPDTIDILKGIKQYYKLVKGKDIYGFSPLHYATKCGHLTMFNDLLKVGSSMSLKSNNKQTVLHIAVQYGRFKICETILGKRASLQNDPDEHGMTPLHLAALCGQLKIVNLLLDKGVSASKDNKNNTPLHLAASTGRVDCMKTLLATHRNLLNLTNTDGNTALHLAARAAFTEAVILLLSEGAIFVRNNINCCFYDDVIEHRHQDVALAIIQHPRWNDVFQFLSAVNGTFMLGLIKKLPDICLLEYNFTYLNLPDNFPMFAHYNHIHYVPLLPLEEMVKNNRVELLSHPLCINFLRMKWRKYGIHLHSFEMGMYIMYLACLTGFVLDHDPFDHIEPSGEKLKWPADSTDSPIFENDSEVDIPNEMNISMPLIQLFSEADEGNSTADKFVLWYICIFCFANLAKIVLMLMIMKLKYLSYNVLLDFMVYVTAAMFAFPFLNFQSTHLQWNAAALCVFLSWFNCLINLQRFDLFGIYVVMFMEILKTLIQVLLIFSVLNFAFGLSFYVLLLYEINQGYSTPLLSIYHTFMMLLEPEYLPTFNDPLHDGSTYTIHFPIVTYILLLVFLLLMPILLMNLLIGLAVGDIEAVQREARLKRLATQVSFHSGAESKLPYLRSLTEKKVKIFPNHTVNVYINAYNKLVGMAESHIRDRIPEENTFLNVELEKSNKRLEDIASKLDKNISLMSQIMKKLKMDVEEEMWDEGKVPLDHERTIEEVGQKKKTREGRKKL